MLKTAARSVSWKMFASSVDPHLPVCASMVTGVSCIRRSLETSIAPTFHTRGSRVETLHMILADILKCYTDRCSLGYEQISLCFHRCCKYAHFYQVRLSVLEILYEYPGNLYQMESSIDPIAHNRQRIECSIVCKQYVHDHHIPIHVLSIPSSCIVLTPLLDYSITSFSKTYPN